MGIGRCVSSVDPLLGLETLPWFSLHKEKRRVLVKGRLRREFHMLTYCKLHVHRAWKALNLRNSLDNVIARGVYCLCGAEDGVGRGSASPQWWAVLEVVQSNVPSLGQTSWVENTQKLTWVKSCVGHWWLPWPFLKFRVVLGTNGLRHLWIDRERLSMAKSTHIHMELQRYPWNMIFASTCCSPGWWLI